MQEAKEMSELLSDVKRGWGSVAGLPGEVEKLRGATEKLESEVRETRRLVAGRAGASGGPRPAGGVTRDCAEQIAAHFIVHCERSGKLEALAQLGAQRDALTAFAKDKLGLSTRSALSTSDIPLPSTYGCSSTSAASG